MRHTRPFFILECAGRALATTALWIGVPLSGPLGSLQPIQSGVAAPLCHLSKRASQLPRLTAKLFSPTEVIEEWHWLFTPSLAVLTASKRAIITTQRASRSLTMMPRLIARCAERCSSFPAVIRRFPASSKMESMCNRDGAIRFGVERSTTDGRCVRPETQYLLEGRSRADKSAV